MGKIVFVALLLLVGEKATRCRAQRRLFNHHPSQYLEPPPVSRSIKTIPLLHKPPPLKHLQYGPPPPARNHLAVNSVLPKVPKWSPPKQYEQASSGISSKSVLQTRSHDYAVDEKTCNPCNSVPWIPILGVGRHVAKQLEPVVHHQPTSFAADSYYSSFNEMSSNLKPINVVPSAYPVYLAHQIYQPDLTQSHLQDNHIEPAAFPVASWNPQSFSAPGLDSVQEPSIHNAQIGLSNQYNNSADDWLYQPKAMPLSHYLLSVEHPMQIIQTPLLDVPSYQLPTHVNVDLPSHVQHQVHQPSSPAPPVVFVNHFTSPSADAFNDQYNALGQNSIDDTKYSPSESKFASLTVDDNHIVNETHSTPIDFVDNATDTLIEYLTPPTEVSNDDWTIHEETPKKKKQIQIVIPYTIHKNHTSTTEKSFSQRLRDIWGSFMETTTTALPIVSYLKSNSSSILGKFTTSGKRQEWSDMLRLQKAIDTWTVEGYSNHKHKPDDYYFQKVISSTLSPSKEIPSDYLASTISYQHTNQIYRVRGVPKQIPVMEEKMHHSQTSRKNDTASKPWEKLPVSVSPLTKEKVYIVTPLPLTSYNFSADGVIENWP